MITCMKRKKIYVFFAVFGIIIGSLGVFSENKVDNVINATKFTDINADDWFYPYVLELSEKGIIKGITENTFSPNGSFTVAESCAIITRYLGLENEAEKRRNAMTLLGINGSDLWYSGYVQLMHEAGVIDVEAYGCSLSGSSVSIDNPELFGKPVKRYEFVAFISRSFELEGTNIRTSSGGTGSEFIKNGYYDEARLASFANGIKDYSQIPDGYNYYVLKMYYNGIFNGDDLGNFNPLSNLTRGEMAKVVSVIYNSKNENAVVGYTLQDDCFYEYKGIKYLRSDVTDDILYSEAISSIYLNQTNEDYIIKYTPSNNYPKGYSISFRHYRPQNNGYFNELEILINNGCYSADFKKGDVLLLVLKDAFTGESVDAYELKLLERGIIANSYCNYKS